MPDGSSTGAGTPSNGDLHQLVERLRREVVGRVREIELTVAAIASDRHIVIEGPPGTGKSTLLRAMARELGIGFEFVEGNAELTPARVVGHFDPARVLSDGYDPDVFVPGPLAVGTARRLAAVHRGTQPRSRRDAERADHRDERAGDHRAAPRSIGGRSRLPPGCGDEPVRRRRHRSHLRRRLRPDVSDRRRLPVGRATRRRSSAERSGCRRIGPRLRRRDRSDRRDASFDWLDLVVELVRATRVHPTSASVRRCVVRSTWCSSPTRSPNSVGSMPVGHGASLDAALVALSGRIRVREGSSRTPEEIVTELWESIFRRSAADGEGGGDEGKAGAPTGATNSR